MLADVSGGETSTIRTLGLHKLLGDWGEGTSGWGLGPGGTGQGYGAVAGEHPATWTYQFYNADAWTNAGGDFAGTASATTSVGMDLNSDVHVAHDIRTGCRCAGMDRRPDEQLSAGC